MTSRIQPLITVAELDACPDDGNRYELIEGELFVSRAAGLPHQLVLANLQFALASYLKQNPIGTVVPGPGAVFSHYDAVIPDLVFVRNETWDRIVADERFVKAPDLVIEILSPGKQNRERDLLIKRQLYSRYGVEEYWIVDPENRSIEIYRLLEQSLARVSAARDDETLKSAILPGLELEVQSIFDR
jgi:Uma2 family endonuclease